MKVGKFLELLFLVIFGLGIVSIVFSLGADGMRATAKLISQITLIATVLLWAIIGIQLVSNDPYIREETKRNIPRQILGTIFILCSGAMNLLF